MKSKSVSRIRFGLTRIVALFMAAAMLTFGVASCSSDSGDGGDEAKTYSVKVEKAEHGTVVASAEKAEAGKTITLVATAEDGYVFEACTVKDADGKSVEVKGNAFEMPASDVTVSATFKEKETTPDTPTDTTKPADSTANKAAADAVIAKINAIGTVAYTAESKAKIDEARTAYNALTEAQKALVSNYGTLTTAESTYSTQKAAADEAAANQAAANAVITKISAIGTVEYTTESKAKIGDARTAYDALTGAQKALVTNYGTLTAAESTYSTLKATADEAAVNQVAANAVTAKINAIGTVEYTTESKAKIDDARTAYDALTEAQKNLVTNYATLTSAESTYASWTSAGGMTVTISPNPAIAITKSDADGSITLTASTGFTGYSWLINGKSAASVAAASVSSDGTVLTLTKAQLSDEVAYQVALNAAKNGITYGAQITVSK